MSPWTNYVLTLFQIFCFTIFGSTENNVLAESKRLLLADPDVIQAQIHSLETKLQDLTAKNQDVTERLKTLEQDNTKLKTDVATLETVNSELRKNKGVSYIRWGRKDCPSLNTTELIYSGIVGGGAHSETGNGVNYLCLPEDPDQPNLASSIVPEGNNHNLFAHVYGSEYQFSYANVKEDDDVPCAVCLDTQATTKMMIPGKTSCPAGWKKHYEGFLCSSYYGHNGSSEFECLDINPQYINGRRNNLDGKLFYPAIAKCGSLECPPYEDGKYISCVICTR